MDARAGRQDAPGIAARAEGAIDDHVAGPRGERLHHLVEEDGNVRG
jgi:hypothetical protein